MTKGKQYLKLETYPMDLSDAELQATFRGLNYLVITRSLLIAEHKRCQEQQSDQRTMRNLWYRYIKPIFSRLGLMDEDAYANGKVPKFDKKLSEVLADLVRNGHTTYEHLNITDGSRQRRTASAIHKPLLNTVLVGAHYPGLVLFTEKDTIYPEIESLAQIYGLSVISGGGQPSLACTENTVIQITGHEKWENGQDLTLITFTDYDPHGYLISNAQAQQLVDVCAYRKEVDRVRLHRLGLLPDQLSPEERSANVYQPPKGKTLDKWFEETGGVDGEPLGLELDALTIPEFRALFVSAIQKIIPDESEYHEELRNSFVEMLAWEDAEFQIRDILDQSRQKFLGLKLECEPDTVAKFARAGFNAIDPVEHDERVFNALKGESDGGAEK